LNWWSRKKVQNTLGVDDAMLNALTRSGLLGYTSPTVMYADHAVRSYQRFGTQWVLDRNYGPTQRVMEPETYESVPPVEEVGPQPPATQTHAYVWGASGAAPDNMIEHATKTDRAWITHFYLVTNYFYFPNLTDLALIGPPLLALSGPRQVPGAELPITLYPHPSGYVGSRIYAALETGEPSRDVL
jgi:hypothetical protein